MKRLFEYYKRITETKLIEVTTISWRIRVSIPVPITCEASALPFELIPLDTVVATNISMKF